MFRIYSQTGQRASPLRLEPENASYSQKIAGPSAAMVPRGAAVPLALTASSLFGGILPGPDSPNYASSVQSYLEAISFEQHKGDINSSVTTPMGPFNPDALSEFIKYLVYMSSNNMLSNEQSDRFLQWIIDTDNLSMLRAFFSKNLQTLDGFARSLFESALELENSEAVRILLNAGVDPSLPTRRSDCSTPLQLVARRTSTEILSMLLEAKADVDRLSGDTLDPVSALQVALQNGRIETARMLLSHGASVNTNTNKSALCCAVENIHEFPSEIREEIIQELIDAGADVNAPTQVNCCGTILQSAVANSSWKFVKWLLDAGADINAPGTPHNEYPEEEPRSTVLLNVSSHRRLNTDSKIRLSKILLDAGAKINAAPGFNCGDFYYCNRHGMTALQGAILNDRSFFIGILAAGADVNAPAAGGKRGGRTALQQAAELGRLDYVSVLLDAHADVNAPPAASYGVTALQAACEEGHIEIIKLLLEKGASVNEPGAQRHGHSSPALFCAVKANNIRLAELLLAKGASVNGILDGQSALQVAVMHGRDEMINLLLRFGADIHTSSDLDATDVLWSAVENGNMEIVQNLISSGVQINKLYGEEMGSQGVWVIMLSRWQY